MKVFDLCCQSGHRFEGWFSSVQDYERQKELGLVTCPICGSHIVERRPSAPYIGAGKSREERHESHRQEIGETRQKMERLRQEMMAYVREASKTAVDVGSEFVPQVRAMHEGTKPVRNVKGLCSEQERKELLDEGIVVLPIPESAGKTLN